MLWGMMNERVPRKDLALRKSSKNAIIIIQTESNCNLLTALHAEHVMGCATLGVGGR